MALLYFLFKIKKMTNKTKYILAISVLLLFSFFVIIPTSYSSIQKHSLRENSTYEICSNSITVYRNGIPEIAYINQRVMANNKLEIEIFDAKEFNILGPLLFLGISTVLVVLVLLNRLSCKDENNSTVEIEMVEGDYHEKQI